MSNRVRLSGGTVWLVIAGFVAGFVAGACIVGAKRTPATLCDQSDPHAKLHELSQYGDLAVVYSGGSWGAWIEYDEDGCMKKIRVGHNNLIGALALLEAEASAVGLRP